MTLKVNYDYFSSKRLLEYLGSETGVRTCIRIGNQTLRFARVVTGELPREFQIVGQILTEASTLMGIAGFSQRIKLLDSHSLNVIRKKTLTSVTLWIFQANSVLFGVFQIIHYGAKKNFYIISDSLRALYLVPLARRAASISVVSRSYYYAVNGCHFFSQVHRLMQSTQNTLDRGEAKKEVILASLQIVSSLASVVIGMGWICPLPHGRVISASLSLFTSICPEIKKILSNSVEPSL